MKKVGIATFQFADNYGAVLQCYALQKTINRMKGFSAEVINYIPANYKYPLSWSNECEKNKWLEKRRKIEQFLRDRCNLIGEASSVISADGYDICCIGSDQVWNPISVMHVEYLLPHVTERIRKISYAASIACPVCQINSKTFEELLPLFESISVREREHLDFVKKISGKRCECVVDPTLLIDRKDYEEISSSSTKFQDEPYILLFWLPHGDELYRGVHAVHRICSEEKLNVKHNLFGKQGNILFPNGECMYYDGIEDFLSIIRNASYVVTNSYHTTILSIIFDVPFFTYVVDSMKSRFDTLSYYSDLSNRFFSCEIRNIREVFDFKRTKDAWQKEREKSLDFLKNALDERG